jgi:hypothetical protein
MAKRLGDKQQDIQGDKGSNRDFTVTIYAPMMVYTALCKMLLCGQHPLLGQMGGGWALEIEFFGSCEMASSRKASAIWGPNEFSSPKWHSPIGLMLDIELHKIERKRSGTRDAKR